VLQQELQKVKSKTYKRVTGMEHPATFLCRKQRVSLLRVRLLTFLRYVREFKLYNLRRLSPRREPG
jgi:hypothetical protein